MALQVTLPLIPLQYSFSLQTHPPQSVFMHLPDVAPYDSWLFPKVEMTMKSTYFELVQDTEGAMTV